MYKISFNAYAVWYVAHVELTQIAIVIEAIRHIFQNFFKWHILFLFVYIFHVAKYCQYLNEWVALNGWIVQNDLIDSMQIHQPELSTELR